MKTRKSIAILTLLIVSSVCNASNKEKIVREIVTARLGQLQNLRLDYNVETSYTPPAKILKKMITKNRMIKEQCTFSFLEGMSRYAFHQKEKKTQVTRENPPVDIIFTDASFLRDKVYRLFVPEDPKMSRNGVIGNMNSMILPTDSIEIGLGMRGWGQDTWLTPQELAKMEIKNPEADLVIFGKVDAKSCIHEWTFDRKLGYALTLYRRLVPPDNHVNIAYRMDRFKNVNGVMLPYVITSSVTYAEDGELKVAQQGRYEVIKYELNNPENTPESYRMDWPDNTIVYDEHIKLVFRHMNGMIYFGKDFYLDEINDIDNISAMSIDVNKSAVLLFIPKIDIALKRNWPFILDLKRCKLIHATRDVESSEVYKQLIKSGKGDLAWDGSLLTTRDSDIFSVLQESHRPLKGTARKWSSSYKLPEEIELPYKFLIRNKEGQHYLINIHTIASDGIRITCKELDKDELANHKSRN